MITREDILRELELLPIWQPREPRKTTVVEVLETEVVAAVTTKEEKSATQLEPISRAEAIEVAALAEPDFVVNQPQTSAVITQQEFAQTGLVQDMDWQALQRCVQGCNACSLAKTRTQTVFGVGDMHAEWLIVGEAPGAEEDQQGEPFVGQAGKLLDNMLASIQLKRGHNVYIANVLKCRPPANRDPKGEEVLNCDPFLKRQVALIKPKLIVALGKFAAQSLLQSENTVTSMRGSLHDYHGVPVIVTYHPAYLLRNLADKAKAWEDLCFAKMTMQDLQLKDSSPS